MRAKLWLSCALVAVAAVPALPAAAQTPEQDQRAAERAADQIQAARDRADAAAAALARAETAQAQVEDELAQVQADQQSTGQQLDTLRASLRQLAVQRYMRGDVTSIPLASSGDDLSAQVRADVFLRFFALGSDQTIDDYRRVGEDLSFQNERLAKARKRAEKTLAAIASARKQLEKRIVDLQEAEKKRQADAAVRRILEARRAAEFQRQQAAAAAAASRAGAVAASGRAATNSGGGSGPAPAARPVAISLGGIICPVAGPSAFVDTYGAARSGGRRHEGVDMLGSRGTPIVAVVAGTATPSRNRLGGNAVWLKGSNGFSYYYAHLDRYGASGGVNQGDVIGYMGDTGNARGTVHLHWEVHPGGGRSVDPYPYARAVC